tara:strand:- start:49 stop:432 length:384 start_codon:yes stop_codon:yes gene_type:complete
MILEFQPKKNFLTFNSLWDIMGTMKGVNMDEYETVIKENVSFDKVPKNLMNDFIDSDTAHYMNTLDSFRDPETDQYPGYDDIQNHPEWKSAKEEVIQFRSFDEFAIILDRRTAKEYCTLQHLVDDWE